MVAVGIVVADMDMVEGSNITVDSVIKLITDVGKTIPVVMLTTMQCR